MIIKKHNRKLINNNRKEILNESCNCRIQATCPLKVGNCRTESIIYEVTVSTKMVLKIYWIVCQPNKITIKCKPENINYIKYINSTELLKLIHKINQENTDYDLSWTNLLKKKQAQTRQQYMKTLFKRSSFNLASQ